MRLDREEQYTQSEPMINLVKNLQKDDVILISDYNKGVINQSLVNDVVHLVKRVYVDPKQNPESYTGAYLVKPNMKEYEQWFGKFDSKTADQFRIKFNWDWLIVTDGGNGIHVVAVLCDSDCVFIFGICSAFGGSCTLLLFTSSAAASSK